MMNFRQLTHCLYRVPTTWCRQATCFTKDLVTRRRSQSRLQQTPCNGFKSPFRLVDSRKEFSVDQPKAVFGSRKRSDSCFLIGGRLSAPELMARGRVCRPSVARQQGWLAEVEVQACGKPFSTPSTVTRVAFRSAKDGENITLNGRLFSDRLVNVGVQQGR